MQVDQHADHDGFSQETIQEVQPEEVLVISLGTGPQITPGMMSENEVLTQRGFEICVGGSRCCGTMKTLTVVFQQQTSICPSLIQLSANMK